MILTQNFQNKVIVNNTQIQSKMENTKQVYKKDKLYKVYPKKGKRERIKKQMQQLMEEAEWDQILKVHLRK